MFKSFYNLSFNPFAKSQRKDIAFETNDIKQVSARLDYLKDNGGIGLIVAEPGAGKTFATRKWANSLNLNTVHFVYICMSTVTNHNFYIELCRGLGIDARYKKSDLFADIQNCIKTLVTRRRMKVVVVIDEAHHLPTNVLIDLPMITNFEMDSKDLMSVTLIGQTYLTQILSRQPHNALRQRIMVNYQMQGLSEKECVDYVKSQLKKAGGDSELFSEGAIIAAYKNSASSIRTLNAILTCALKIGVQQNLRAIDTEIIQNATQEISIL